MPNFPSHVGLPYVNRAISVETAGINLGTTELTDVLAGSVNAFGNWVQLLAATSKKTIAVLHIAAMYGSGDLRHRVQIGKGAAGQEQVVTDMTYRTSSYKDVAFGQLFFAMIPAGTRIAARAAAEVGAVHTLQGAWLFQVDD